MNRKVERVEGIEPSSQAWKASALPLSYTRKTLPAMAQRRAGGKPEATAMLDERPVWLLGRAILEPCAGFVA